MPTLSPFKKYDLDHFASVVIPLDGAPSYAGITQNPEARSDDKLPIESLRAEVTAHVESAGHDSAYERKCKVINKAMQDIGMGRYQWQLFLLCCFGWLADNLWLQDVALTLPSLSAEYGVSSSTVRYTTLSLFVGLCIGAVFWGVASDIWGRRLAFNCTLLITSIFGLAVGGTTSWLQACVLFTGLGCGVGGNLPVDGALFLEFLPCASSRLLTMLSISWPIGQFIGSMVAWGLIPKFSCREGLPACTVVSAGEACCTMSSNMGWRYLNYAMGSLTALMFICRFALFHLFESPKFLLSRGLQREAVTVVHGIAWYNGSKTWLTEDILNEIGGHLEQTPDLKLSKMEIFKRQAGKFSTQRIKPIFASKRLAINTSFLWFMWAAIGMGYPLFNAFLPQYLTSVDSNTAPTPPNIVYRNYAIQSIVGVPGSILAMFTVDMKYIGKKGTMAVSTLLTGIFLYLFTTSTDPTFQLIFNCLVSFFQNIMYGVLYAYTPETFPAPNRGTGTGVASFFNRVAGLCAPIVAIHGSSTNPRIPIYISGAFMLSSFVAMVCLPIETRGRQIL